MHLAGSVLHFYFDIETSLRSWAQTAGVSVASGSDECQFELPFSVSDPRFLYLLVRILLDEALVRKQHEREDWNLVEAESAEESQAGRLVD
jgi:hypothetical protein